MKIIVCIKQVPDTKVPIDIEQNGTSVVEDGLIYIVNPDDLCALEAAVQLKEALGGEVTAITLGTVQAEEGLRTCLAMGADRAVMLEDQVFAGGDSFSMATALAQALRKMQYDLILTGSQTLDGGHGQVPAAMAEMLGLPFVSGVTCLEKVTSSEVKLHRKLERGDREVVESTLPAVIGVTEGINCPRYPSLPAVIWAQRQKLEIVKVVDLGLRQEQLGAKGSLTKLHGFTPPRPRPKKTFAPDSSLSPAERMRLLMSGGMVKKNSSDFVEGEPDKIATQIVQFLQAEKII